MMRTFLIFFIGAIIAFIRSYFIGIDIDNESVKEVKRKMENLKKFESEDTNVATNTEEKR